MKIRAMMYLAVIGVSACSSQAPSPELSIKENEILILAPQGVDPSADTVGINDLTKRVTQAFSASLSTRLKTAGKDTANVLDQSTRFNTGQKLAIYSAKERAAMAIVLTVETSNVGGDQRLSLRAQCIKEHLNIDGGTIRSVTPDSTFERFYVLRGSKSGDNPRSMSDLAEDLVNSLKANGWIQATNG